MKKFRCSLNLCLFVILLQCVTLGQGNGKLSGKVIDASTKEALPGATIILLNTILGASTDINGNYSISVAAGKYSLKANYIGYVPIKKEININAGENIVIDFTLQPDVLNMNEVVITGTGGMPVEKSRLGNAISVISTKDLQAIPTGSLTQTLNSRTTGVQIWNSSGLLGTSSLIQLRGVGSLTGNTSPLIYVDGIRISNTNTFSIASNKIKTIDGKDQQSISTLNLINPADIERVEILKGASAATLYGSDAANGVIQIFTKTGAGLSADDKPIWNYSATMTNYDWSLYNNKFSKAAQAYVREGTSIGNVQQLSTSGKTENFNYFAGAAWTKSNNGISASNQESFDIKSNFTFKIDAESELKIGAGFTRDFTTRPDADNASQSTSGFFSHIMKLDTAGLNQSYKNPYSGTQYYEQAIYEKLHNEYMNKRTSGLLNYSRKLPLDLHFNVNLGLEEISIDHLRWIEYGFLNNVTGSRATERNTISSYNGQAIISGSFNPLADLNIATSAGAEYYRNKSYLNYNSSGLFSPGFDNTLQFGDLSTYSLNELQTTYSSGALFAQSQMAYINRMFLTLGLRCDKSSSFGSEASPRWYPKASLSYMLPVEESVPFINMLRLRGSIGQAGNQPDPGAADLTFIRQAIALNYTGIIVEKPGESNLKPSRTTELEIGFDISALNSRLGFEFTYYSQKVKDDLFGVMTKPSDGYGSRVQVFNLGEIETKGFEVALYGTPIESENFGWASRINFSTVNNKVLNDGGFAFTTGPFQSLSFLRVEAGHPIGEFYYASIDFDKYGNLITPAESYRGKTATPKITGNWTNDFIIYKNLTVSLNFGWSLDFAILNLTRANLHRNGIFDSDFTQQDNDAGLAASKKTDNTRTPDEIAALIKYRLQTNTNSPVFLEDGDFLKLREAGVNYLLPKEYYSGWGVKGINLSLSAYNVFTITKYKGFDPEVSVGGSTLLARGADNRSIPSPRTFVFKLSLQF